MSRQIYDELKPYVASRRQRKDWGYPSNRYDYLSSQDCRGRTDRVYAMDCEMVTTEFGQELAQISVVDHKCDVIVDTYVETEGTVINYHTPYSGVTFEDLDEADTSIDDIHDFFMRTFSAGTILVGHSLEHDFNASKFTHGKVVDVSLVYLNNGQRVSLKRLARDILGTRIQEGTHDAAEDALACMQIMLREIGRL